MRAALSLLFVIPSFPIPVYGCFHQQQKITTLSLSLLFLFRLILSVTYEEKHRLAHRAKHQKREERGTPSPSDREAHTHRQTYSHDHCVIGKEVRMFH